MWILVLILTALNYAQFYRYRRLAIEIRKLSASVVALIAARSNTVFYSSAPTFAENKEPLRFTISYTNEKPTTKH